VDEDTLLFCQVFQLHIDPLQNYIEQESLLGRVVEILDMTCPKLLRPNYADKRL
jgi:hypothetical protein